MKILKTLIVAAACATTSVTHGQEIAVNFDLQQNPTGKPVEKITSATGVVSVAAADWNNVDAQGAPLTGYINSSGAILPNFTLTVNTNGRYQTGLSNLGNLFYTYGDSFNSLTASNIPYMDYDVYVYVGSNGDGREGTGKIGTETLGFTTASGTSANLSSFTINSTPDSPVTYPSVNTLEFANLTSSSFTYSQSQISGGSNGVFGFEIVDVPEPSTWAMLLVALAFLGFCVRRKAALLG
jgi:hypothetical protein